MLQKINSFKVDVIGFAADMFLPIMVGAITFGTVYAIQEALKALFNNFKN